MSMLDPDSLAPIRDDSAANNDSAPRYDNHRFDQRYHPSPEAIAAEAPGLESHPPLSTITSAELGSSRKAPPPHFSSLLDPNDVLPSHNQMVDENRPHSRLSVHSAAPSLTPSNASARSAHSGVPAAPVDNKPEYLTLDKDLIFPPPPSQALYSLKFAISATGTNNMLSASVPSTTRADGTMRQPAVQDKDLYALGVEKMFGTFVIQGQRRSTVNGDLVMRRAINWHGKLLWQCKSEKTGEVLIQTKGDHWLDNAGNVLGREGGGVYPSSTQLKARKKANQQRKLGMDVPWKAPVLELKGVAKDGSDGGKIRHLLVACWVAKCWYTEVSTGEHFDLPPQQRTKFKYIPSMFGSVMT